MFTSPGDVHVEHVVALKEAWDSGAWQWTEEQQTAFGNDLTDPRTLLAVSASSNAAKSDRDPTNWLPMDSDVCRFIGDWISIKARWSLAMDQSERTRIENLLRGDCQGWTIAAWAAPPVELPPPIRSCRGVTPTDDTSTSAAASRYDPTGGELQSKLRPLRAECVRWGLRGRLGQWPRLRRRAGARHRE